MDSSTRLASLADVTEKWLTEGNFRRQAVDALSVSTGYSTILVEDAIDKAFGELTLPKLQEFISNRSFASRVLSPPKILLHIAAGNVFTSWLFGVYISLLMGFTVWFKPSRNEPVFSSLFRESLLSENAAFAEGFVPVRWSEALCTQVAGVIAYGSDDSLGQIKAHVPEDILWIGYGHKASIGVAFKECVVSGRWEEWTASAAEDVRAFNLEGCLSPQILLVEEPTVVAWRSFLSTFAKAPRLESFSSPEEFLTRIIPFKGKLSSIGVAGPMARIDPLRESLEMLEVTRICKLGNMQRPTLDWRNGGIDLPKALAAIR